MSVNKPVNSKSKHSKEHITNSTIQIPLSHLLQLQTQQPQQTSSNNSLSMVTHEYIGVLLEMQKLMLLKFDTLEQTISKLAKENQSLISTLENLETKSEMLITQVDNLCGYISEKFDDVDDNVDDNNCQHECNEDVECCNKLQQMPAQLEGQKGVPIEMIINQILGNGAKPKEKTNETEVDEEYDINEKIYSDEAIVDIPELQEFEKIPTNIDDLLELGEICTTLLDNSKKKKKKLKIEKQSDTTEIKTTNDIIISELYELEGKKYAINIEKVVNLIKPLTKLNNMVGMKQVKESVFEMILYYLQGFETRNQNMLHSVIEGPPGTGKTQLGKILAQIYCSLGIIESNRFQYVKATDLIGDHVGATKHMTQRVIDEADGGVLFIDEAYALSSNDGKDPYGKECIDTLNFNLSEKKKKLIVIVAGYPDQLDRCFFAFNPGLQRRFPFRHRIDGYSSDELRDIFVDKLKRSKWKLDISVQMVDLTKFFKSHEDDFVNFGGDIENLFKKCQYAHSNRVVGKNPIVRKRLNMEDINNGFKKFKGSKRNDDSKPKYPHMYI